MGAAVAPLIGAGASAGASAKGSRQAGQASDQAAALQQQALGLANPPSVQAGRENFAQGINQQIAPNFIGDQGLAPGTGFRDISGGGDQFQFQRPELEQAGGVRDEALRGAQGIQDIQQNFQQLQDQQGLGGRTDTERFSLSSVGDAFSGAGDAFESAGQQAVGIGRTIADPGNLVLDPESNILSEGAQDFFDPLQLGGRASDAQGGGAGGGIPGADPSQLVDFSGAGSLGVGQLGALNQLADVAVDPRVGQLANQQANLAGQLGPQQQGLLQDFSQQVGNIGEQTQGGLQNLLQQASGAPQDLASLISQGQQGGAPNLGAFDPFLGVAGGIAQDGTGVSQFTDPLQAAQQQAGNLSTQVTQEADQLISANEEQSRFEQEQATQSLNDQLAARGLANSSAAIEALTSQNDRFSRGRAQDASRIRSQAQNQRFQQQLGALGQQGNLASIGGQLFNAGQNTQLRGAGVGGELAGAQGRLGLAGQGQNAQELFNLFQTGRQGRGDISGLLGQLGQNRLGTAETQFGLNQQALNQPLQTLQQQQGILGGNEARVQGIGQQAFSNRGAVADRFSQLFSQLGAFGQQAGGQASAIQSQGAQNQFQNAIAQQQGSGQAAGQALNFLSTAFNQPQQQQVGTQGVPTATAPQAPVPQSGINQNDFFQQGALGF